MKKVVGKITNFFSMKKFKKAIPFFEKWEENVHFPMGTYFFNGIGVLGVFVGILAIIVGLVLVLWFCTPTFKTTVEEPKYETSVPTVTDTDVLYCAAPETPRNKTNSDAETSYQEQSYSESENSVNRHIPDISLAKLEQALPSVKFVTKGRKYICDTPEMQRKISELGWDYYDMQENCYVNGIISTRAGEIISNKLQGWFPYDSLKQQNTIDQMADHISRYNEKYRKDIYEITIVWFNETNDVNDYWNFMKSVDDVIVKNENDIVRLFRELYDFNVKNQTRGRAMTKEALKILALKKTDSGESGYRIFKATRSGYKRFIIDQEYEYDFWESRTNDYIGMTKLHENIPLTIECFYEMIIEKDKERIQRNQEMEEQYKADKTNAEADYIAKKNAKRGFGVAGGIAIAGGIVGVILICVIVGMLLLLFSIQRNVKKLEERIGK